MGEFSGDGSPSNPISGRLAISLGDPAGIGGEVVLKALARPWPEGLEPVLVGCRRWLEQCYTELRQRTDEPLRDPAELELLNLPLPEPVQAGCSTAASGDASFHWLTAATELVQRGNCRALVTAPIAKASWHAAGHLYPGQTERVAELAGSDGAAMLFTARNPSGRWRLNTLLATTHIPLAAVPTALDGALVERRLEQLLQFCRRFTAQPRLVVARRVASAARSRPGWSPAWNAGGSATRTCTWRDPSRRTPAGWKPAAPGTTDSRTPPTASWPSITIKA